MAETSAPQHHRFAAIVVAAGKGLRAGLAVPKQFAHWQGKPMLRLAIERLRDSGAAPIVAVIPADGFDRTRAVLGGLPEIQLVAGGETRQQSVCAGLEALALSPPGRVLIHDAARPDCPPEVVARLLSAIETGSCAIPVLQVVDSLVSAEGQRMAARAERALLRRVQTPQAFRFAEILAAHRAWPGPPDAGDDAQVAHAAGLEVVLVEGDERLRKFTYAGDFAPPPFSSSPSPSKSTSSSSSSSQGAEGHASSSSDGSSARHSRPFRVGTGYDVHRLAPGEELWLCGVRIEHERGLAGHSDADVALHAVVDAILGAAGQGDIGQHFPPSDPQWRGASSARFIEHAVHLARQAGYAIGNVDCTIICEAPRIGPHRDAMRTRLAYLLGVGVEAVNVKATTTERLGFTGRGEGIAAQAVIMLIAHD